MVFIPKSILIALKPHDEIAAKMTGRFTSTSTWCLCSISWATNSLSSAWKSIRLFLASDETNRLAVKFYSSEYFQVQVCWCGGDRRELPETTKSAAFQNSLFLQHPLTEVVTKIHQHSWGSDRPLPGFIKCHKRNVWHISQKYFNNFLGFHC